MQQSVNVGDRFPASELVASDGRRFDLESLSGPAVVYFYPADGTSTCTLQAVEFNRALDDYEAANVALFGVSIDDDESHRGFAEEQRLRFPLVADDGGELTSKLGLMKDFGEYGTMARRFTFLLDRNAIVRATWAPEEQDLKDHPGQALEAARALEDS
ncbi:MAG TPA: peroxiredoxin [Gaiellales bacterium]|nr:peroxiredoxin [Gaiellales bacterium]